MHNARPARLPQVSRSIQPVRSSQVSLAHHLAGKRSTPNQSSRFMDLDVYEMGFFIQQVGSALTSLGFDEADVTSTASFLDTVFNYRCSPEPPAIPASAGPQLQSICIAHNCPLDANATCS